jgi:ferredoxin
MAVTMRLRVDPIACAGHGLCADLLAERIELDEWGFPIITGDVPAELAPDARRAVRACPTLALTLWRTQDETREQKARHRDGDRHAAVSASVRDDRRR